MTFDAAQRDELRRKFVVFAETRSAKTRGELIEAHLGLAEYLARRFSNRGEPLDDLTQVASVGLLKAVDRFDPERGVEFSTYATHTIVGELKRHFRDKGWAVRAPRRMQELYLRLGRIVSTLSQELGRSPTIPELAAEAQVSEEEVLEALEAGQAYRFASLDAPSPGEDEGDTMSSQLGEEDAGMIDAEHRVALSPLLAQLPKREQVILHLRFFEGLTQSGIAERLGISQMHVSRLLARSLAQLRAAAEDS
ncbi:MAG TPA: SigB/SigF/SigG family RNA polymerase sigma factor [Acidimicrobiales bacterium]|nr:SigB/SigF/SigG family RNA polymerase sigma factor [Acidimicrobiales bacterium]